MLQSQVLTAMAPLHGRRRGGLPRRRDRRAGIAMSERLDIEFDVEGGVTLAGWLYLPDGPGPHAAITMAHGYAGVKEHGLERFARAFADDGFVVLVHDHRGFASSGGEPRHDVDPCGRSPTGDARSRSSRTGPRSTRADRPMGDELRDHARRDRRPPARRGRAGPDHQRLRAGLRRIPPDGVPALEEAFAEVERAQARGEAPRDQAIVDEDPAVPAS
jgi:hypothetical protein